MATSHGLMAQLFKVINDQNNGYVWELKKSYGNTVIDNRDV